MRYLAALPPRPPNVSAALTPKLRKQRVRKRTPKELARALARARENSVVYNLTLDVQTLRQQVYDLAVRKTLLQTRVLFGRFELNDSILRQYFTMFRTGLRALSSPDLSRFLASVADDKLILGVTGFGLDMLVEQWRRYTELFQTQSCVLMSTKLVVSTVDDSCVVRCTTNYRAVFTHDALATILFPIWKSGVSLSVVIRSASRSSTCISTHKARWCVMTSTPTSFRPSTVCFKTRG